MPGQVVNVHENRLINKAAENMDGTGWKELISYKVTPDQLQSAECKVIFEFAVKRHRKDGRYPSRKILKQTFPTFRWENVNEAFSLLVDTFRDWRRSQLIHDTLSDAVATYTDSGSEDAFEVLAGGMNTLRDEATVATGDVYTDDYEYFEELMERRADTSGTLIATGFPSLDKVIHGGGLRPGELVVLIARDKVGKSTLSMQMAINAQMDGAKVVYQTYEMDGDQTLERYLAQLARVSPDRLSTGSLKKSEQKKVDETYDAYDEDEELQPLTITQNIRDIDSAYSYAEDEKPDLLIIDGAYFMENAEEDTRTQEIEAMLRHLLMLAQQQNCVVLLTTQALESKMNGHRLKSTSGAHSSAWQQYAHLMIGLERVPIDGTHETEQNMRKIRVLANRIGRQGDEIGLDWNWDTLSFCEAGMEEADE